MRATLRTACWRVWPHSAVALTLLGVLAGGCPVLSQTTQPAEYGPPKLLAVIDDARLTEASGIVASRRTPGVYYTHNDSGGKPRVFVVNRAGEIVATINLRGATNYDCEDIALAPGSEDGTFDVCLADIGDNYERRADIVIYRFAEPELPAETSAETSAVSSDESPAEIEVTPAVFRFRYESGPHNAEGFVVHPLTGAGYVFTKHDNGTSDVFEMPAPWSSENTTEMKRLASLRFSGPTLPIARIVTAADIAPDGRRLVTRSYLCGWEWSVAKGGDPRDFAALLRRTPTRIDLPAEPQGEALCFSRDGDALLTISEKRPTRLYEVGRRSEETGGEGEETE